MEGSFPLFLFLVVVVVMVVVVVVIVVGVGGECFPFRRFDAGMVASVEWERL